MQNYVQGITEDIEKMQSQGVLGANEFGEITGEMLLNKNIKEIPSLLEPLLPKSGLVCLAGSSDTGKSAFLRYRLKCNRNQYSNAWLLYAT